MKRELPHVAGEQKAICEAWLSWELVRRGVLLGGIGAMNSYDIANACGFSDDASARKSIQRATDKLKVTQAV